ncbi:LacI family DNA-binding transcriptional regulator [uncultured Paenibacillus sp.]|uniref:LacI family DNA-binding transcriptional regulator n=1 Tax=uncultured Paenibacillus sp. TaxID=227322 RepID=UPI0028D8F6D4|nr:LacI family DNA-binding transcriptional regulator [uncultured Paenibacillus sp.]
MANISDVVRLSGVSKSTVSRVINNYPHISKEKKERVLKAMEELGYTPNLAARRLRGQFTTTIGVIVPRIVNPFFSNLVDAIEKVSYQNGYQTIICQSNLDKEKELTFLNLLKTKQADGIIMTAIENDWSAVEPFTEYGPIVLCNEYVSDPNANVSMIRLDQFKGAFMGVKHLIERGHRKIAYCTGGAFTEIDKDNDRNLGYRKALEEAGIEINPNWIIVNQHTIQDGKKVMKYLLELKDRPTAVFTGSDEVAGGILSAAKQYGFSIPGDLAIVGFDDQPAAELLDPGLTTIRQPVDQMGRKAVEVLVGHLNDPGKAPDTYELPIELVIRKST